MAGVRLPVRERDFSLIHKAHTGVGAKPASYSLVPGVLSPGLKLTTYLHIVLRSRMVELYLHSVIRLHCVVNNNELSTGTTLPLPLFTCHEMGVRFLEQMLRCSHQLYDKKLSEAFTLTYPLSNRCCSSVCKRPASISQYCSYWIDSNN
jgi:hypothetical protein